MNTLVKRLLILVVVVAAAGGAYAKFKPSAAAKKDVITYEYGAVSRGNVRSFVTATGVIQPWKIVDVKSNVSGRIDKLLVDLGDKVKQDQVIALINKVDPQSAFDQANSDVLAAVARVKQAEANWTQQMAQTEARIAGARKSLETAKARRAQAIANNRVQPEITLSTIAQAQAALVSAQKQVAQAEQSKQQLVQQLEQLKDVTIPLNIASVEANVDQAKVGMSTMEAEYRRQRELNSLGYVALRDVQATYAQLATAKASVRTAEQRRNTLKKENEISLRELRSRINETDSRIDETKARVIQAQATLKLAEQQNNNTNEVRGHELTAANATVEQAQAELESAIAERTQIVVRKREIDAARAQTVRAGATLKRTTQDLEFTNVTAPRDGVVIAKNVEEGTVVPSSRNAFGSTSALLQVGDISRLWVVCDVDETDIGEVRDGQKVTVKVDAYPLLQVEGKVIRIDPQAKVEQNVTLIPVTVEISKPDPRFLPGMNATCEFTVAEALNVVTIPNEALQEADGVYKVEVKGADKPKAVEVEVGLAGPEVTEIRSGLEEGEEVVTRTIEPEKAEASNPFNPFGGMGRRRGGAARGGAAGGARGGGAAGGARPAGGARR
ncbi:MAG: efflux RND transporter periplasmic adaptor subunit [Actinomycetota bacterium]